MRCAAPDAARCSGIMSYKSERCWFRGVVWSRGKVFCRKHLRGAVPTEWDEQITKLELTISGARAVLMPLRRKARALRRAVSFGQVPRPIASPPETGGVNQ